MSELKPCPFCGGKAMGTPSCKPEWVYEIKCTDCGAKIKKLAICPSCARREAIEAWNTRHERTCRNEFDRCFAFECSECGVNVEGGDMLGHNSSEGAFNFCPNCGAKVVGE